MHFADAFIQQGIHLISMCVFSGNLIIRLISRAVNTEIKQSNNETKGNQALKEQP